MTATAAAVAAAAAAAPIQFVLVISKPDLYESALEILATDKLTIKVTLTRGRNQSWEFGSR
jgi:hypothetical protein